MLKKLRKVDDDEDSKREGKKNDKKIVTTAFGNSKLCLVVSIRWSILISACVLAFVDCLTAFDVF